jgi:hypothetical protein
MSIRDTALPSAGKTAGGKRGNFALPEGLYFEGPSIKFCAALSLLLILFAWFDVSGILQKLSSIDAGFVLLAIGIFILQFALSCLRWVLILGRQSAIIEPRKALSIYGVGTLANLFLLSSIAGMSVRAGLLLRAGTGLSGAIASITAERIAAVIGLGLCGIAGVVFALPEIQKLLGPWADMRTAMIIAAGLAILGAATFLLFRKIKKLRSFALKVWMAFSSPRQAILLIAVSASVVLLGCAGMAVLAVGMGLSINPVFFVSVMPAIALISALPITVGGWGVREGAMVAGLSIFSVPADTAIALSISYGLGGLLVALMLGAVLSLIGQDTLKANKS